MSHLQASCAVPSDGSLSSDSFRAARMTVTEDMGHLRTHALQKNGDAQNGNTKWQRPFRLLATLM